MKKLLVMSLLIFTFAFTNAQSMNDGSGRKIGSTSGESFYDGSGRKIGYMQGESVYDGSGRKVGSASGLRRMQIIIFFYFFM